MNTAGTITYGTNVDYRPTPGGFAQIQSFPVTPNASYDMQFLMGDGTTWFTVQTITVPPSITSWPGVLMVPNGSPQRLVQK